MKRTELEEMSADEFYELPEMKLAELICRADDDTEKVLIIDELLSTGQKDEGRAEFVNWIKEKGYGVK